LNSARFALGAAPCRICIDFALKVCNRFPAPIATETTGIAMPCLRLETLAIGFCASLIACSGQGQSDPPTATINLPSARPASINGNYNGIKQLVSGAAISCGTQDIFSLQVQDSRFRYVLNQPQVPWRPSVTFNVVIAPNGSFHAASGAAYIDGKVSQGHMQGQIVGDSCGFQFEADNVGSF
jgi:hypothetical protein